MPAFTVLVLVGPNPREIVRLHDLLDSLFFYEPDAPAVVLVDDAPRERALHRQFRVPPSCLLASVPNPRRGRGQGMGGGLCTGLLAGLAWIQRNLGGEFVLKADTDALVIGPFADNIADRFRELPRVGMLGTHIHDPDGSIRPTAGWVPTFQTFLRPICLRGKHLQITLWGRSRKIREALTTAMRNGYRLSEHCQGGAYAISNQMLERMAAAGYLDDPLCWLRSGCVEDLMMGMYAYAVGLGMSDCNRDREPFGVQHLGLPDQPERLLERGYGVIHCLKDHGLFQEEATRDFFRAVRGNSMAVPKGTI